MTCRFYLCFNCCRSFDDMNDLNNFINEKNERKIYCAQCVENFGNKFYDSINDTYDREKIKNWAKYRSELISKGTIEIIKTGDNKKQINSHI